MTARGRLLARLVTTLIALAGFVMAGALPAAGQPNSGPVPYVALGDSYAAGQGGGDYLNECLESPNGYPYLLDPKMRIDLIANVACTGAKASDLVTSSTQLSALDEDTELVTITVGAADLNLSEVLAACTAVPPTPVACQEAIAAAQNQLEGLVGSLTTLYGLVRAAAPNALIVVTGYPYLFEPPAEGDPNAAIITAIRNAITALNTAIQQAVTIAQNADINIIYVDVTEKFAGHGIGSKQPFINATGPDAYHPNVAGYRAYAKAIFAAIRSVWKEDKKQAA